MARRQPRPPGVSGGRQLWRVASSAALGAQATELERCPGTPGKRGAGIGGSSTSLVSAKHPHPAVFAQRASARWCCARHPAEPGSAEARRAWRISHVQDACSGAGRRAKSSREETFAVPAAHLVAAMPPVAPSARRSSGRKIVPHRTTVTTRGSGIVPAHACGPPVRRAMPGLDARRSLRREDRPTSDTTAASGGTSAWRASARSASRPAAGRPRRPPADPTGPGAAGPARRRRA